MPANMDVYECELCGNIVEVVRGSKGALACCGQDMKLLEEKSADSSTEKHVPVIEKTDNGYKVTVGSTLHPMEEEHYIEWIELICDNMIQRVWLKPGDAPAANFQICCNCKPEQVIAREHCNKHGLWKG